MTDESQSNPPMARPPVSILMWVAFTLGLALVCMLAAGLRTGAPAGAAGRDGLAGLAVGLLLAGGLALSERFFAGRTARVFGGLAFAALLAVGGAAVGFAGCIPYPYLRTVKPRAAAVPPASAPVRSKGSPAPASTPQPTPHKVLDWGLWPLPNANDH